MTSFLEETDANTIMMIDDGFVERSKENKEQSSPLDDSFLGSIVVLIFGSVT
jgi:hypothetical protein